MNGEPWTTEELAIANLPIAIGEAHARLRAIGSTRSLPSINVQRERQLYDPERALSRVVYNIATKPTFRTSYPSAPLVEAVSRNLVKRRGKSVYEITLGGIAYLNEKYGDRWRE